MNAKVLMISSALVLGALGILFPEEVAAYINLPVQAALLIQFLGAAYFGIAMLNWMAKGNLIGGIYSKPVALGNYAHFLVGVLAPFWIHFLHQPKSLNSQQRKHKLQTLKCMVRNKPQA